MFRKGQVGEDRLEQSLKYFGYRVYSNVILRKASGIGTFEVDMIAVGNFGVCVFEVKSYVGTLSGGQLSKCWWQTTDSGKISRNNAYFQNKQHIQNLKEVLPSARYHNMVVVYCDTLDMKADMVTTEAGALYRLVDLPNNVMSPAAIDKFCKRLEKLQYCDNSAISEHTRGRF